ncbi:ABC transporter permease [Kiloniella sp.]|uniref:ABC transporter permease n=1 Tax=Kiloniella sp. TaxID=1938587 RepID=UPI003A8F2DA6
MPKKSQPEKSKPENLKPNNAKQVSDPNSGMNTRDTNASVANIGAPNTPVKAPEQRSQTKGQPVPFRGGGFAPVSRPWMGFVVFFVLIAFLEAGTRIGFISALTMPKPSDVFNTFVELYNSGLLWTHLVPSLTRFVIGAAIGSLVGVSLGIAIGLFSYVRAGLVPLIAALFPVPKIALLPLFVIWFGIDEASKYALIAFGTFTPMVVATYGAVDNVDRGLIRMGQSFNLSWFSIVRKIVLPGAMAGILSGLRIALAIAIILLVAAEMLGAEYGIGAYILQAGSLYDLERLFTGVAILSILGVFVNSAIGLIEKRVLRWRGV